MVDRIRRQIQAEEEALKVAHVTFPGDPPKVPARTLTDHGPSPISVESIKKVIGERKPSNLP